MIDIFLAVFPISLLILCGHLIKGIFKVGKEFWNIADKLTYYLFFPSLLILEISHSNFSANFDINSIYVVIGSTIIISILLFILKKIFDIENKAFTSIYQGSIRFNSYIFIACSDSIFGKESLLISSIFISYMIIITNVLSVIILNKFGTWDKKKEISIILKSIFKNPLIIGTLIGLFLNFFDLDIPKAFSVFMLYIGSAATPMSLLSIGAGLVLSYDYKKIRFISISIILKLILLPILTIIGLKIMAIEGVSRDIALLYSCLATAGNSYILSKEMGGRL